MKNTIIGFLHHLPGAKSNQQDVGLTYWFNGRNYETVHIRTTHKYTQISWKYGSFDAWNCCFYELEIFGVVFRKVRTVSTSFEHQIKDTLMLFKKARNAFSDSTNSFRATSQKLNTHTTIVKLQFKSHLVLWWIITRELNTVESSSRNQIKERFVLYKSSFNNFSKLIIVFEIFEKKKFSTKLSYSTLQVFISKNNRCRKLVLERN